MGFMVAMAAEDLRVLELTLRRLLVTRRLHQRPSHRGLASLQAVVDVGSLHLRVLPVVGGLGRQLAEAGLEHVEENSGAVETLDHVLAEVRGSVRLVSGQEQLHRVVLHKR